MKKMASFAMVFFLMLSVLSFLIQNKVWAATKQYLDVQIEDSLTYIKVKWPTVKGAAKYEILRSDATDEVYDRFYYHNYKIERDSSKYVKIKTVKDANSYKDTNVNNGNYYRYHVNALDSRGNVLATSNTEKDSNVLAAVGISEPTLKNMADAGYYEKKYITSSKKIAMYIYVGVGGVQKGLRAEIYRKEDGDGKYKKIDDIKLKDDQKGYNDKTVKEGGTYSYKVRLYKVSKGKKYYSVFSDPIKDTAVSSVETPYLDVQLESKMNYIKVKWPKVKSAAIYVISRADVTDEVYETDHKQNNKTNREKNKYKKIKTVKDTNSYKDKDVMSDSYYSYHVNALDSEGHILATNNNSDHYNAYDTIGISKPYLRRGSEDPDETETEFISSNKKIGIYIDTGEGGIKKGLRAEIYRKKDGKGKYEKIDDIKIDYYDFNGYNDKTVKSGSTYRYKVRLYKVVKGKKYYSEFSDPIKDSAVSSVGTYKIKSLTPSGKYSGKKNLEVKLKITAGKSNGNLWLSQLGLSYYYAEKNMKSDAYSDEITREEDPYPSKNNAHKYTLRFKKYSYDGKNWKSLPKKNRSSGKNVIKGGETIYIKAVIESDDKIIYYGGSDLKGGTSYICSWAFAPYYESAGSSQTLFEMDLLKGKGKATGAWDLR